MGVGVGSALCDDVVVWPLLMGRALLNSSYAGFGRIHKTLRVTPAMEAESPIMFGRWKKLQN